MPRRLVLILGITGALLGCTDDEDAPYIDPDALSCCRCIATACPDGGPQDAGPDADEE